MALRFVWCTLQNMRRFKLPECKCEVCGHVWHPRTEQVPLRCAKCKSCYWNRPKPEAE